MDNREPVDLVDCADALHSIRCRLWLLMSVINDTPDAAATKDGGDAVRQQVADIYNQIDDLKGRIADTLQRGAKCH